MTRRIKWNTAGSQGTSLALLLGSLIQCLILIDTARATPAANTPRTIEDAVRQSGGVYMPSISGAGGSDIANTIEQQGLTNSDPGSGNLTLQSGIVISGFIPNRFTTQSYVVTSKTSERGTVTVHANDLSLFLTLFDESGRIIATSREKTARGDYSIDFSLKALEKYIAEVFINTDQITSFNPEVSYQASYTITYTSK